MPDREGLKGFGSSWVWGGWGLRPDWAARTAQVGQPREGLCFVPQTGQVISSFSGSACSSNHPGISGSLKAIGVKKELLNSTLRFSFSVNTRSSEIDYAAAQLEELLPLLRRYTTH